MSVSSFQFQKKVKQIILFVIGFGSLLFCGSISIEVHFCTSSSSKLSVQMHESTMYLETNEKVIAHVFGNVR